MKQKNKTEKKKEIEIRKNKQKKAREINRRVLSVLSFIDYRGLFSAGRKGVCAFAWGFVMYSLGRNAKEYFGSMLSRVLICGCVALVNFYARSSFKSSVFCFFFLLICFFFKLLSLNLFGCRVKNLLYVRVLVRLKFCQFFFPIFGNFFMYAACVANQWIYIQCLFVCCYFRWYPLIRF